MMTEVVTKDGTGIVARVDDLGRIVVPKPMRARLGLRERSQVLITGNDDTLTIRKFHPYNDFASHMESLEVSLEEISYSPDIPAEKVAELTGLVAQMREVIASIEE